MRGNHFLFVIMLSLALVACDKNEVESNVAITDVAISENQSKAIGHHLRTLWGEWNWYGLPPKAFFTPWYCFWPSHNCLPTVVISGSSASSDLERLLEHVREGTTSSYFLGDDYKNTFGIVDSFPVFHELLISDRLSFDVQTSDTLDRHLYVIGYDVESEIGTEDALVVFEIDIN